MRNTPARAARVAAGLSLQDAARRLRVTPQYLGRCEREGLPFPLLRRIVPAYGCRIEDLITLRKETPCDA